VADRLERLLKEAEKKRKRLKYLQSSAAGTGGYEQLRGEQWNDALKAASGEKTLVIGSSSIEGTEGKIKKALKKREKQKARSALQWSERIAATEDDERSKQMVREHNLKKRIMKKKGVDIDEVTAKGEGGGESGGRDGSKQPQQKRPRLFMVQKYKEADEKSISGGGGAGGAAADNKASGFKGGGSAANRSHFKGGGGRDGKGHHYNSKGGHGEKGAAHRGNNRAGFEGKKRNGEYLNK